MSKRKEFNFELNFDRGDVGKPAFEALGLTDKELENVISIPLSAIDNHPRHTYKVLEDNAMLDLVESIKLYGVLEPILVRKVGNRYECIAGHRRRYASQKAGKTEIKAIVLDISEEDSDIFMNHSNKYREEVLISEKAWGYRVEYDALKRKAGTRTDLSGEQQGKTIDLMAADYEDSKAQIKRYIKITELLPAMLDMVDQKKMPFRVGYTLAYLNEVSSNAVYDAIIETGEMPTIDQAELIKAQSEKEDIEKEWVIKLIGHIGDNSKKKSSTKDDSVSGSTYTDEEKRAEKVYKATKHLFPKGFESYIDPKDVESLLEELIAKWFIEAKGRGE